MFIVWVSSQVARITHTSNLGHKQLSQWYLPVWRGKALLLSQDHALRRFPSDPHRVETATVLLFLSAPLTLCVFPPPSHWFSTSFGALRSPNAGWATLSYNDTSHHVISCYTTSHQDSYIITVQIFDRCEWTHLIWEKEVKPAFSSWALSSHSSRSTACFCSTKSFTSASPWPSTSTGAWYTVALPFCNVSRRDVKSHWAHEGSDSFYTQEIKRFRIVNTCLHQDVPSIYRPLLGTSVPAWWYVEGYCHMVVWLLNIAVSPMRFS